MLSAEARVETERSSRYLVQLCRHVNRIAQANPQMQAHVDWSDDHGVISFGWGGRCTLRADPGILTLRAEAPDQESLRLVQHRVTDRLERFGRRDQLTVSWTPPQGASQQLPRPPRHGTGGQHMADPIPYPDTGEDTGTGPDRGSTPGPRRWVKAVVILAIGLVLLFLIVLHLMGGGFRGLH
jgi:hypothetical protein